MLSNFRTYQLAKQLYLSCQELKLRDPIRDQMERASLSIVLNLAEGTGKLTPKDRRRFYSMAMGSLREVQAMLDILGCQTQLQLADQVGGSLYRLIQMPAPVSRSP